MSEECFAIFKIVILLGILYVLVIGVQQKFAQGPADASQVVFDMPTASGNSTTQKNSFSGNGPDYYPMADEAYLNKYLYGMDAGAMSPAAIAGVEAPIFSRLNSYGTGAYSGMGDSGVYQMTNDLLVAKNLGAGQCASGQWVGDTTACPEALAHSAPGPESFAGNFHTPYN